MIERFVKEIRASMDCDLLLPALALSLTLPDTCGKAEYPGLKVGERYIRWYDENVIDIGKMPRFDDSDAEMPHMSGEVVYSLRCQYLHQGTPNIEKNKIKADECKIDLFCLIMDKKNDNCPLHDTALVMGPTDEEAKKQGAVIRMYDINVRWFCECVCTAAEKYHKKNKEKFHFIQYEIEDYHKEIDQAITIETKNAYFKMLNNLGL